MNLFTLLTKRLPITAVSRNCSFLFFRIHEKRLSLTENNPFAGFTTDEKQRNVTTSNCDNSILN